MEANRKETMPSTELRDLIYEVSSKHPNAVPADLARFVVKLTPPDLLEQFYEISLVREISAVLGRERDLNLRNVFDNPRTNENEEQHQSPFTPKSNKLKRRRTWWASLMESRIPVEEGYKRVGSCTVGDLEFVIARREKHIDDVRQSIERYQRLVSLMIEYDAETVDDLPEQESGTI